MKTTFNKILNISLVLITLIAFGGKAFAVDYVKVTDASKLAIGDEIILVNEYSNKALSTTQNGNNRGAVAVTITSNTITDPSNVEVITLGKTSSNWTLYAPTPGGTAGYLYAASSSSNYLRTQASNDANGQWTISITSGNATITAQGSNTRKLLQYNTNSTIFSCYSGSQTNGSIQIYKKTASSYTVTVAKNQDGWGTISATSVTNVAPNTSISASSNVLTVGGTTITATAHAQDADYNYAFSSWSDIPAGGKVTGNITVTANFTRTERALTNYRTSCCQPLASINGSVLETTPSGVTLQWDDIANVSGWTVTGVDEDENAVAAGNIGAPTDMGTTYNCAISNLTSGKTYTFTITPTHTSAYCDVYEGNIVNNVTIPYATSTVTFNANGATSGNVPVNITQNTGTKVYVPGNSGNLLKTNYDFAGWNTQDDGEGDNYEEGEDFDLTGNITLYAKWDCAKFVNITKGTPSNGSFNISATGSQYTCDGAAVITLSDITPSAGYRFKEITAPGSTSIDQTNKTVTYAQYANGSSTINVEFEQIPTYTITWSVNGQTSTTNVTDGSPLVLPTPAPTVDGCDDGKTFVGWTATAIVGSTDTKPGDLFTTVGGAPAINADKTFYAVFATPGSAGSTTTDVLNRATTGVTSGSTSYTAWSNKKATTDAVYAGKSAGGNDAIQLRTSDNKDEGLVTTTSGGKAKKVTVSWESHTASGRIINIYGKNSAYSAASDLYGNNKGTLLGTIINGTSTELTITGDYEYIGICSSASALYLSSVSIIWETVAGTAESGYITSCTKQVAVTATDGGTATINGEAVVDWTSFETDLALVATPSEGYVFAGWSYDKDIVTIDKDNAAEATANSLGAATITANFVPGSTISADKESLALVAYVDEPDDITVTFTSSNAPQYGSVTYTIEDWTDTDDTYITVSPTSAPYLATSNLNQTVTVSYGSSIAGSFSANLVATAYNTNSLVVGTKIIPITLTVKPKFSVTVEGAHAATKSATPNTGVKDGTTVTLSQTAADGWVFQKWTISYTLNEVAHNENLDGNTFTMPAADVTATAVYTEKTGETLDAPTNADVDDESITSHSATLSWDANANASSYSIYIMDGEAFEQTINGITETSYTISGLKGSTDYLWTVTAIGDGENYYNSSAADGEEFTTTARVLSSIAIKKEATKMTYNEGETFVKTGLSVTATYDDATTATIEAANLEVPTSALTAGTTSITVSYTESGVTKETTLSGLTVNEMHTATWTVNGVPYGDPTYTLGAVGTLPANPSSWACSSKYPYFVKWVIGNDVNGAAVTPETVIDDDVTINAVFAKTRTQTGIGSTKATSIVAGNEYVIGADKLATDATKYYFSSYDNTKLDQNQDWGLMSTNTANAIVLTASGNTTTFQLKDASDNYVKPLSTGKFQMSESSQDLSMTAAGAIKSTYYLRHNYNSGNGGLRWYNGTTTGTAVYLYPVEYSYSNLIIACPATYSATVGEISNGSVGLKLQAEDEPASSLSELEANTTVLMVATPNEGYEFGAWTVMNGENNITSTNVDGNTLTMPAGNVSVSASFTKIAVNDFSISGASNVQVNNDVVWTLDIDPTTARPTIVWSSADEAIATVSNGTVHGVAVGSTTISATVDGVKKDKEIEVIATTVLNNISISTPQTEYTLGDSFVAPTTVTANYIYEIGGGAAPSADVTASATITGYNMNEAGEQEITVSYETKTYKYNITVAPWTLHLQTKRMYGDDVETPSVVDAEVTSLSTPTDLTAYYVSLCAGYEQIGYITSSANVDALPNDLLTSYTPSANNETLYGVFKKTNYAGEVLLTENFTDAESYDVNFPSGGRTTVTIETGCFRLGSGNGGGSITTKTLSGLSHKFKVELKAKKYDNTKDTNAEVCVTFNGTTKQSGIGLSTSTFNTYSFEFDGSELYNTVKIATLDQKERRIYVDDIQIYTEDDVEYMSVYDCREEKSITYNVVSDQATWTACEDATVLEGKSYIVCANEPTLHGYDFGGWIVNDNEENILAAGTEITVDDNMALTAKWTAHVYDYHYDLSATATNGSISSVTVNGVATELAAVELHDGDVVVVTATANENYEFDSWTHSNNVVFSNEGGVATFTVNEGAGNVTVAANFVEKAKYTITLNVFGRTYTTKQGYEGATYSSVINGAVAPAVEGYTFQGWSTTEADNTDALISGDEILTADVTLYAIIGISRPTGYVYNKVTNIEDVIEDGYYLIVNETANKAFNGNGNLASDLDKNDNYVTVAVVGTTITSNADIDAAVVTIGTIQDNDSLYIKTATGFYIGNSGSNGLLANKNIVYRNALSFIDGNFVVNSGAKKDNTDMVLRFNSGAGNGRFGYYKGTNNPVQLYKRGEVHETIFPEVEPTMEITTNTNASDVFTDQFGGDVIVKNGATLTIDDETSLGNVIVENGGSIATTEAMTVNDLIIHSTLGKGTGTGSGSGNTNAPGNSGQIANGNNITVTGDVYLELDLTQDAEASEGWYAFSVPFQVDALNGVYYGNTKLQNEVGYAIMSHDGALRAENKYAWKKFRGIMQPGVFYVITVGNTDYKTLRFKKVAGEALVSSTDVAVSEFPSQTGNDADGAWNGIGNPNLQISNLSTAVPTIQFYDHKTNSFTGRNHSMNLVVGSAFFIQYGAASTVSISTGTTSWTGYLAPQRERNAVEETIYEIDLTNVTTGELEDNVFLTAREDATNEYEIGRDVAKMSMGAAKCAQMYVPAYGTKLCAADFPLVNNKVTYPLTINAPQAGTYSISTIENENATIYLTRNGRAIWNLSMSACELDLTQGLNEGYGLRLVVNAPAVVTGVDQIDAKTGAQKVIIDEHVYILRGGQMYDVNGKMVK